jgi:phenylacetate-CoA ligase
MGPVSAVLALVLASVIGTAMWLARNELRIQTMSLRLRVATRRWLVERLTSPWARELATMATGLRGTAIVTLGGGAAVVCGCTALFAHLSDSVLDGDGIVRVDRPIVGWLAAHREPALTVAMRTITTVGSPVSVAAVAVVLGSVVAWRSRSRLPIVIAALALAGFAVLVTVAKLVVGRQRPPLPYAVTAVGGYSFPSGHTIGTTVVALTSAWMLGHWVFRSWALRITTGTTAIVVIGAVGLSRVYLGVHYLSDVIAGWLLGAAWAGALIIFVALWERARSQPRQPTFLSTSWDAYRTRGEGEPGIARRQLERLRNIVAYARTHSVYLAGRYRSVPELLVDVRQLPMVTKAEMMRHFDEWVTDRCVKREQVEAFIADPGLIGHDYLGRYVVCTTSGATGIPAIVLHDHAALVVYNVLGYLRSLPVMLSSWRTWAALLRGRARLAAVFVTGGHYLGNTMMARRHRIMPWRERTQRIFSALAPVDELVKDLNAFRPVMLGGYPSALQTLANEQQAGRLHIHPVQVNSAGETLTADARQQIAAAFGCRVGNYYGSSEAAGLTYECAAQRLHVNSDWYIVEPVDEHDKPVPPGQLSHDVLVTNLANRVQPIIRYRLGDRVAVSPDQCPCGSPFPQIRVIGRTDDILKFPTLQGDTITILPLAIATVAEETPGVECCQLVQRTPSSLTVRLRVRNTGDEQAVWAALRKRLAAFLAEHGATTVAIEKAAEPPALHPRSGKFRQVYSEATPQPDAPRN